ncbi:MAG: hypothetical protein NVS4B3_14250 [Gemmatimonadaceae bacterium]
MSNDETGAIGFRDASGAQWEVRELQSPGLKGMAPSRMSLPDFRDGWLLFAAESGERRRLAPFPDNWRTLSERELASLAERARRVPKRALREEHLVQARAEPR